MVDSSLETKEGDRSDNDEHLSLTPGDCAQFLGPIERAVAEAPGPRP